MCNRRDDLARNNIGDRGAMAIANNLKQLTVLSIRSHSINNSAKNNVGEKGAVAIADNLKNLKDFDIGMGDTNVQGTTTSGIRVQLQLQAV